MKLAVSYHTIKDNLSLFEDISQQCIDNGHEFHVLYQKENTREVITDLHEYGIFYTSCYSMLYLVKKFNKELFETHNEGVPDVILATYLRSEISSYCATMSIDLFISNDYDHNPAMMTPYTDISDKNLLTQLEMIFNIEFVY